MDDERFHCSLLRCNLTTEACARRHLLARKAPKATNGYREASHLVQVQGSPCAACAIGAINAERSRR